MCKIHHITSCVINDQTHLYSVSYHNCDQRPQFSYENSELYNYDTLRLHHRFSKQNICNIFVISWRIKARRFYFTQEYSPFTKGFVVPLQPHPTTSRRFDSFQGFSTQSLCFIANNTYLPFPHFAHNWHSLSSAAFGGFFLVDSVPYLSHWAFGRKVDLYFLPGRLTWP